MTALSSRVILDAVASGKISPEQGAVLVQQRREASTRPTWMPRWIYGTGIVLLAVLFAPLMSSARDQ